MSQSAEIIAYLFPVRRFNRKSVEISSFPAEVTWCFKAIAHAQQGRCRLRTRVFYTFATDLRIINMLELPCLKKSRDLGIFSLWHLYAWTQIASKAHS